MSTSATTTVLHLPELLELILLYLPQKDLLLSQRTARSFRNTILGSTRLQKALFLAPDWSPSNPKVYTDGQGTEICKPENNRLLLRAFPGCYPTVTLVIVNDQRQPHHSASHSQAHPQTSNNAAEGDNTAALSEHWSWDVCISFPSDRPPDTHPAVLYPEASWRRMFLSQPPCTSLHLVRRWQRSLKPAIVRTEGIRMGEFVEEAARSGQGKSDEEHRRRRDSRIVGDITEREGWHQSYISSDRDWHFEGNIRYSDFSACKIGGQASGALQQEQREKKAAEAFAEGFQGYLFSRRSRNGIARAMSDDWDPGQASGFARAGG